MSMVWLCPLTVDEYASMGRAVKVPRPECPSCLVPVVFWSGYWRHVRRQERERKIFIPRVRCRGCGVTHALLPAFVLARRLDAAGTVAVRLRGDRREPDRRQRILALPDHRQVAFHASQEPVTRRVSPAPAAEVTV